MSPPISTAVGGSPGMPSVSAMISAPPIVALFAVSAAMTPSTTPDPKRSGVFEALRAWE